MVFCSSCHHKDDLEKSSFELNTLSSAGVEGAEETVQHEDVCSNSARLLFHILEF